MRLHLLPGLLVAGALAGCGQAGSDTVAASVNDHGALGSDEDAPAPAKAAAPAAGEPAAAIRAVYRAYEAGGDDIPDPTRLYSRGLRALIEADRREANGEIGRLDFDPWINGQDWDISGVEVDEAPRTGAARFVVARFRNSGTPNIIRFELLEEDGRWVIDDIVSTPREGDGWRLRGILSEPM